MASTSAGSSSRLGYLFVGLMLGLLLLAAALRFTPNLARPLEGDELTTLRLYTALGYDSSAEQDRAAPAFAPGRWVRGWAKALMNGWDPNHHAVHNLAVSVSQAVFGLNERADRLPAALASIAAALALGWLAWRWTGNPWLAAALGLVMVVHPYFLYYGQTARGYSFNALLLIAQIAVIDEIHRRPRAWLHVLSGALGIAIFFNLVSMLTMWTVPLYVALILATRDRQRWLLESLAVFTTIGAFILAKLPVFLNTQAKYGYRIHSFSDLLRLDIPGGIAPGWWMLLLIAGLAGCIWSAWRRHWFGAAVCSALLFTAAFVAVGKKVPYHRTFGCFLIYALIGLVLIWRLLPARPWRWALPALVLLPVAIALPAASVYRTPATYGAAFVAISERLSNQAPAKSASLIGLPWIYGEELTHYLPADRSILHLPKPGPVNFYLPCELVAGHPCFRTQYADFQKQELVYWPLPAAWEAHLVWQQGRLRNYAVPMDAASTLPHEVEEHTTGVVLWESSDPFFNLNKFVAAGLQSGLPPWTRRMSLNYYLTPKVLTIYFSGGQEYAEARELIATLEKRTDGQEAFLSYRAP